MSFLGRRKEGRIEVVEVVEVVRIIVFGILRIIVCGIVRIIVKAKTTKVGMVWYEFNTTINQSINQVGIELLGQLKIPKCWSGHVYSSPGSNASRSQVSWVAL